MIQDIYIFIIILLIILNALKQKPKVIFILLLGTILAFYYYKIYKERAEFLDLMQKYLNYYKTYVNYYYLHTNASLLTFLYENRLSNPIYYSLVNNVILYLKMVYHKDINTEDIKYIKREILNLYQGITKNTAQIKRLEKLLEFNNDDLQPYIRGINMLYY